MEAEDLMLPEAGTHMGTVDELEESEPLIGKGFQETYNYSRNAPILVDPKSKTGGPLALSSKSAPARALMQYLLHSGSHVNVGLHGHTANLESAAASPGEQALLRHMGSARAPGLLESRKRRGIGILKRRGSIASLRSDDQARQQARDAGRQQKTIAGLRDLDLTDQVTEEEHMPKMPKACKGFHSTAHLRSEAFWADLLDQLGQRAKDLGPCRWVEANWFKGVILVSIVVNVLLVGSAEPRPYDFWLFQPCLALGALECAVKVRRWRNRSLRKHQPHGEELVMVCLDWGSVAAIAALLWGQAMLEGMSSLEMGRGPELLIAIFSLLRLSRVIFIVPSLHELARGIMDAMSGLFWVLVLTFLLLYAIAIVCTRLIGHSEFGKGDEEDVDPGSADAVRTLFSSVSESMFLLFQVMSAWSLEPLIPLFEVSPCAQFFFSVFYIFSGWMLMAVMTGTVSFTMIDLRARLVGEDKEREANRRMNPALLMRQVFESMDMDSSGEITKKELVTVLAMRDIQKLFEKNTNIEPNDLVDLFGWIDDDHSGTVSFDEFLYGFRWLNDAFKTKNLLRLREKVTKDIRMLWRRTESSIHASIDNWKSEVEAPVRKLHALSEQVQLAHAHAVDTVHSHEAPRAVADLEVRISEAIEELLAAAECVVTGKPDLADVPEIKTSPAEEGVTGQLSVRRKLSRLEQPAGAQTSWRIQEEASVRSSVQQSQQGEVMTQNLTTTSSRPRQASSHSGSFAPSSKRSAISMFTEESDSVRTLTSETLTEGDEIPLYMSAGEPGAPTPKDSDSALPLPDSRRSSKVSGSQAPESGSGSEASDASASAVAEAPARTTSAASRLSRRSAASQASQKPSETGSRASNSRLAVAPVASQKSSGKAASRQSSSAAGHNVGKVPSSSKAASRQSSAAVAQQSSSASKKPAKDKFLGGLGSFMESENGSESGKSPVAGAKSMANLMANTPSASSQAPSGRASQKSETSKRSSSHK